MTSALAIETTFDISQENVLRSIAHDIRQPLSAIGSIAYYLSLVLPENEKHLEQLAHIQYLVEQSNWILSNGVTLADPRRPALMAVDIEELVMQTVSARPPSLDPPVVFALAADLPLVHLDPGFGRALIENILGLFRQLATDAYPLTIRTEAFPEVGIEVELSTAVPGYRSVSALPPGSALSLDCAKHIASLHGGSCTISVDPAIGISLRVVLP